MCIRDSFSTGQRCTASSRVIVTEDIHDAFVEASAARLSGLKVRHALAEDTVIGPVVSEEQLAKDLRYLQQARDEGAEVIGAGPVEQDTDGYFLSPAPTPRWVRTGPFMTCAPRRLPDATMRLNCPQL